MSPMNQAEYPKRKTNILQAKTKFFAILHLRKEHGLALDLGRERVQMSERLLDASVSVLAR